MIKEFLMNSSLSIEDLDLLFKCEVIYNLDFDKSLEYIKDAKIIMILVKLKENTLLDFVYEALEQIEDIVSDNSDILIFFNVCNEEKIKILIGK